MRTNILALLLASLLVSLGPGCDMVLDDQAEAEEEEGTAAPDGESSPRLTPALLVDCTRYTDIQTTQFAAAAHDLTPVGACENCHSTGYLTPGGDSSDFAR